MEINMNNMYTFAGIHGIMKHMDSCMRRLPVNATIYDGRELLKRGFGRFYVQKLMDKVIINYLTKLKFKQDLNDAIEFNRYVCANIMSGWSSEKTSNAVYMSGVMIEYNESLDNLFHINSYSRNNKEFYLELIENKKTSYYSIKDNSNEIREQLIHMAKFNTIAKILKPVSEMTIRRGC